MIVAFLAWRTILFSSCLLKYVLHDALPIKVFRRGLVSLVPRIVKDTAVATLVIWMGSGRFLLWSALDRQLENVKLMVDQGSV